jgi:hypothetical protein
MAHGHNVLTGTLPNVRVFNPYWTKSPSGRVFNFRHVFKLVLVCYLFAAEVLVRYLNHHRLSIRTVYFHEIYRACHFICFLEDLTIQNRDRCFFPFRSLWREFFFPSQCFLGEIHKDFLILTIMKG